MAMATIGAQVLMWGRMIGAVTWDDDYNHAAFEYTPDMIGEQPFSPSPIHMPVEAGVFEFPSLANTETFLGLPGMLADACPDRYGNSLIASYLARQNRDISSLTPVERLLFMGGRAMGALEFAPAHDLVNHPVSNTIHIADLVETAQRILAQKNDLVLADDTQGLETLLQVGTSAGGARAKAVIAWHPDTGEIRSGQVPAPEGFGYWILKFDGVSDRFFGETQNYGRIEYAYHRLALMAGITMSECRLMEEGGRAHFMTRRFDRHTDGRRIHMQTLCGLAHLDYNQPGAHSWEQAILVARKLGLGVDACEELFRRMVFGVVLRNLDDHTKNISFLMEQSGEWRLSPAYDITHAYKTDSPWVSKHQMTINGKRDGLTMADLFQVASMAGIKRQRAQGVIDAVVGAREMAADYLAAAGVADSDVTRITESFYMPP